MEVVPVLWGATALGSMGIGWDKELPPCSQWPFAPAWGCAEPPVGHSFGPGSCHGQPKPCPLSVTPAGRCGGPGSTGTTGCSPSRRWEHLQCRWISRHTVNWFLWKRHCYGLLSGSFSSFSAEVFEWRTKKNIYWEKTPNQPQIPPVTAKPLTKHMGAHRLPAAEGRDTTV